MRGLDLSRDPQIVTESYSQCVRNLEVGVPVEPAKNGEEPTLVSRKLVLGRKLGRKLVARGLEINSIGGPAQIAAPRKYESMKSYDLALIGGDGTGPEVVREAVKVLDVAAKKFALKLNYTSYDIGGDRYLRTGEVLPDSVQIGRAHV